MKMVSVDELLNKASRMRLTGSLKGKELQVLRCIEILIENCEDTKTVKKPKKK